MTHNESAAIVATVQVILVVGMFLKVPPFTWFEEAVYVIATWPVDALERLGRFVLARCVRAARAIARMIRKRKSGPDELV